MNIEGRQKNCFYNSRGPFSMDFSPIWFENGFSNFSKNIEQHHEKIQILSLAVNYIVAIRSFNEHIWPVSNLWEALLVEGFKLKFSKCIFTINFTKYIEHSKTIQSDHKRLLNCCERFFTLGNKEEYTSVSGKNKLSP